MELGNGSSTRWAEGLKKRTGTTREMWVQWRRKRRRRGRQESDEDMMAARRKTIQNIEEDICELGEIGEFVSVRPNFP